MAYGGLLGGLPPGLRGYVAAEQNANQRGVNQLGMLQGILSVDAMRRKAQTDELMTPLKMEQLRAQIENMRTNQRMREGILGGGVPAGAPAGVPQGAIPQGATGGQDISSVPPQIAQYLVSNDPGLRAYGQAQLKSMQEGAKLNLEREKFGQTKNEFSNLSAYQQAQIANQGIGSAIALAEARDKGIAVPNIPQGLPQGLPQMGPQGLPQAMPQPVAPQQNINQFARQEAAINNPRPEADRARILAGERAGGAGMIPTQRVLSGMSPAQQRGIAVKEAEAPIAARAAFMSGLAGESAKQYAKIVEDSGKVGDQLDLTKKAIQQFKDYSSSTLGGTGPFATAFGMRQYTDAPTQALEATFRGINLKNMVQTFSGMSRAIDTDNERRAWEATQPTLTNDDPVNAQILVGGASLSAKTQAEGEARRKYIENSRTKSLDGYVSPVIGKTSVLFNLDGEPVVVPKNLVKELRAQGLMTDEEYAQSLIGKRPTSFTGRRKTDVFEAADKILEGK